MSFVTNNFSVLAYANGFTLWHYRTSDTAEAILEANYFNPAQNMLRAGDMILFNASDKHGLLFCDKNEAGLVDVTPLVQG